MKNWILLAVFLALGAGGYFSWNKWQKNQPDSNMALRPTTATVEARDIFFAVNAAGDIGPADQVSVRPEVDGRIADFDGVDRADAVVGGSPKCLRLGRGRDDSRIRRDFSRYATWFNLPKSGTLAARARGCFGRRIG